MAPLKGPESGEESSGGDSEFVFRTTTVTKRHINTLFFSEIYFSRIKGGRDPYHADMKHNTRANEPEASHGRMSGVDVHTHTGV